MKKILLLCLFYIGILLLPQHGFAQFEIPPKPDLQTSVYDYANLLSASDKKQLEQKLINYADTTTTQIVIAIIPSLKGESIGILTPKWGHEWGVGGTSKDDNGVFIVLAEKEHQIWISPGYGAEDRMTAGQVGEMTREVIIPEFKSGDYYAGLDKGTDAIFEMLNGKYKGTRKGGDGKESDDGPGILGIIIFIIIIIIFIISRFMGGGGRNGGRRSGGLDLADILILGSLGRSSGGWGGGGSSGGGGGFGGGFGGGGFSGGGAGGSW